MSVNVNQGGAEGQQQQTGPSEGGTQAPPGGQAQQGQQQDPGTSGSILEQMANQDQQNQPGEGGTGGQGEQQGQQQQQTQQGQVDMQTLIQQLEERLGQRFDAIADRRVNAILNEMRRTGQTPGQQTEQQQQQPPPAQQSAPGQSTAAVERAARLAFREYIGDELRFINAEERAFAMDLGQSLIREQAGPDADEDRVGRDVARSVADRVKKLRKTYEDLTVAGLRQRGALVERPGQPPRANVGAPNASEYDRGQQLAKERLASRFKE